MTMLLDNEASRPVEVEEENYFISMTDMMVGLLFIFIIMLMLFALNFRTRADVQESKIEVAAEVARKLQALEDDVQRQIGVLNAANTLRSTLLRTIRDELIREGIAVQVDEVNGVLRLTENAIRFPFNKSALLGEAKDNVAKVARVLARVLPSYTACSDTAVAGCRTSTQASLETVFLEGHTDRHGTDESNWRLSTERAVNTYRELVAAAPDLRRLHNRQGKEIVSVSGYAQTRQLDPREAPDADQRNRRIDLRFVMDVDHTAGLREILRLTDEMKGEISKLAQPRKVP